MRVLVTGGRGFIGQAVVAVLVARGHAVTVLSRGGPGLALAKPVEIAIGDIRDQDALHRIVDAGRFEGIVHLAALTNGRESVDDPLGYYAVNLGGTLALLTAIDQAKLDSPRLVFASTHAVYGQPSMAVVSEDEPCRPMNPYGASKVAAEQLTDSYARTGRLSAVTLRCFNVAGAVNGIGDPDTGRLLPRIVEAAQSGATLPVNGDGLTERDYIHVLDVASAFSRALDRAPTGRHDVYNIGSGTGTSIMAMVSEVERQAGVQLSIDRRPPANEPHSIVADTSRIRRHLDWRPERSGVTAIVRDALALGGLSSAAE